MKYPTFSALERVSHCSKSWTLPRHESVAGAAAHKGTLIHAFAQRITEGAEPKEALEWAALAEEQNDCDGLAELCAALLKSGRLPTGDVRAEVAYAIDLQTGKARELHRGRGRDYSMVTDDEMAGTIDIVDPVNHIVRDYKTGRTPVPPAKSNLQVAAAAYAYATVAKVDRVVGQIVYIRPDGSVSDPDSHVFEVMDLEAVLHRLRDIAFSIHHGGNLQMGAHCDFCPALASCPAQQSIIRLAMRRPEELVPESLTSKAQAREAYETMKHLGRLMYKIRGALASYTASEPIAVDDKGTMYGRHLVQKRLLDPAVVEKLYPDSIEKSVTLTSLERHIGDLAPKGQKAAMMREAVRKIEEANGVVVEKKWETGEYKDK